MEDSTVVKGVFFYTKKLDSELMVRCLQTMLNNLPNFEFTSILRDENYKGYKVLFSSPEEEAVLEKQQLKVSGQDIQICPLKTCLAIYNTNLMSKILPVREIEDAIGNLFGKIHLVELPTYRNGTIQFYRVFSDIPEIKAQEIFQRAGSHEILLSIPNKNSKLKVTLCCTLCKKDGHVARDCKQERVTLERKASIDGESVFADSTMKMDISFESTEVYAEKIGREEIMKTGYFSEDQMLEDNDTPEKKDFKKEPEFFNSLRKSDESPATMSNNNKKNQMKSDEDDDDDDIKLLSHNVYPSSQHELPSKLEAKIELPSTDEESNPCPAESPGPSVRKRRSLLPTVVEDMSVLSESLQKCINEACDRFKILSREKLQAFFHHVKKKSNVVEVAQKYGDVAKIKELLQHITKSYYNTTKTGTKEDKRFMKWLEERIGKFDKKIIQKRKRASQNQDDTPRKK